MRSLHLLKCTMHSEEGLRIETVGRHVVLLLPNFFQLLFTTWMMNLYNKEQFLLVYLSDFKTSANLLYLGVLSVLLLGFLPGLFFSFPLFFICDLLQLGLVLKLLLHFILLELLFPLAVSFFQVLGGLYDQFPQIFGLKFGAPVVQVLGNLLPDALMRNAQASVLLILLNGKVPEPLQFLAFQLVKLVANMVIYILQFFGYFSALIMINQCYHQKRNRLTL